MTPVGGGGGAAAATVVVSTALRSPASGSTTPVEIAISAVLVSVSTCCGRTRRVSTRSAPEASPPIEQRKSRCPGAVKLPHPSSATTAKRVSPSTRSVTSTESESAGPSFRTVTVCARVSPTVTGSGATARVIERSPSGTGSSTVTFTVSAPMAPSLSVAGQHDLVLARREEDVRDGGPRPERAVE
jgi:hypothetical protein